MWFFKIINFLLVAALICLGKMGFSANTDEQDADDQLLAFFEKKCSEVEIKPHAYPDLYYGKADLNSCDIASTFNPDKFLFNYNFLKLANHHAVALINEWDVSKRIVEANYGISQEEKDESHFFKAMRGDVISYYFLAISDEIAPLYGGVGLSQKQIKLLNKHFNPVISELIFLKDEELFQEAWDTIKIIKYTDTLLDEAGFIGRSQFVSAVWRLSEIVMETYTDQVLTTSAAIALQIPHKLRLKILALHSLANVFLNH